MLGYWEAELGPRVWLQDPGILELVSDCWWEVQFLTQLGMVSRASQNLFWPTSVQGWGPAGPRVESALLWAGWVCRLWDCGFLESCVYLQVGEAGLGTSTGFPEFKANARPLVDRVEC